MSRAGAGGDLKFIYSVVITDTRYHHIKYKISQILECTQECVIFTRPLYIDLYYVHMYEQVHVR